jgi:hypothetical protein
MLDVRNGLFEKFPHVVVMQVVDDLSTISPTDDEAEVAQHSQLVRHR